MLCSEVSSLFIIKEKEVHAKYIYSHNYTHATVSV